MPPVFQSHRSHNLWRHNAKLLHWSNLLPKCLREAKNGWSTLIWRKEPRKNFCQKELPDLYQSLERKDGASVNPFFEVSGDINSQKSNAAWQILRLVTVRRKRIDTNSIWIVWPRIAAKKPHLTPKKIKSRLQWCQRHLNSNNTRLENVVFPMDANSN